MEQAQTCTYGKETDTELPETIKKALAEADRYNWAFLLGLSESGVLEHLAEERTSHTYAE